jgi:hypothetical protein
LDCARADGVARANGVVESIGEVTELAGVPFGQFGRNVLEFMGRVFEKRLNDLLACSVVSQ